MRKKRSYLSYLQVLAVLLLLMSLPGWFTMKIQGIAVASFAPAWEQASGFKRYLAHLFDNQAESSQPEIKYESEDIKKLTLENQLLLNEINKLTLILSNESYLDIQRHRFSDENASQSLDALASIHRKDLLNLVKKQLQAVPAQVIFRSLSLWKNSMWINVGQAANESLGSIVVAKNSPVMSGTSLVGVIDYVGENQSRVRLISDSGLTPSVRAVRSGNGKAQYLAKGELRGSSHLDWRRKSSALRGVGFNYDFPDEEGPARDLRTGKPYGRLDLEAPSIIENGDLLITTGMDGVFPPGMMVARVTHFAPLKEGDYAYEIEASPTAGDLDNLTLVFVLPPSGYEMDDGQ